MDAKDLRTESAVSERNNDGSKYSQSGGIALHCDRNKSYQDIGSNSLGKVDVQNVRPCAVIGPDRVVPPPAASEAYHIKKAPAEPWQCMDNVYRRPPEYPHKLTTFQNPTRNISPRQTFQENMQRIMVPPSYNSIKVNDDTNYAQISDRNNGLSKNIKLNVPPEAKFCDVPYAVNPNNSNEQKSVRNPEMCLPSVNPTLTRTAPHGWPPSSVNLRSSRMYGAPELYQYQEYPSCAGPRPVVPRPHRTVPEEQGYVYADPYYQEGNIRFKPYPSVKERYPQQRYEYIGNYSNPFHPPPGFPHKYEIQKSIPPHPYPPYPPIKYLEGRVTDPVMEGYQRQPQGNYNIQYRNQVIHPNYGPVLGNCPQNKMHSYPPDSHIKTIAPNKLPYDNSAKAYIEYDNNRPKIYPQSENYFVNEMARMPMKSQVIMPNYPTLNMHNIPPNQYYKKDNQQMKTYEHMAHFRNMDPNLNVHNHMSRHPPVFSPNTLAISPTDSNTSNDTTQTLGTSQEDCGYVSQSSTASVRSMDSGINRIPNDCFRKYYDNRYGPIVRTSPMMSKSHINSNNNVSKDKKHIDVRQFLQMWNEGDDEPDENGSKEIIIQTGSSDKNNFGKTHEAMNTHEQLYVLGLVNVPSEELAKYEHIQTVSKLPENIKGYNNIELLNQFEEVIESSNMNNYKPPNPKEFQMSMKGAIPKQPVTGIIPPRPVSPLDVEAKISQSVIHKEVGCNFEIKPCSPKMLNVEVAAPVQNILAERVIEKVANPVMLKSPMLNGIDANIDCNIMKRSDHRLNINENVKIPSCKMINTQFSNTTNVDSIKNSYSLQDLESNSGLCLASLPRLDNDIELNFPEVNQQFINANKGDSTVLTTSLRDLPTLEVLDQPDNQAKDKYDRINSLGQDNDVNKSPYMIDSEKEVPKLSKYRKTKNISIDPKESPVQHNINPVRTDSVIIKNPENIKNHEDNSDISPNSLSKAIVDIQNVPINLTSQGNLSENEPVNINNKPLNIEIAIDFSLNKTGFEEAKVESSIENPIHIHESSSISLILNDDPLKLSVDSDINENINNTNNIGANCTLTGEKESSKTVQDTNVSQNTILNTTPPSNEIDTDMICESNNFESGSPKNKISDTEMISKELENDINNHSCFMDIDKHIESAKRTLEDVNYTLTETDSSTAEHPRIEELQKKDYEINATESTVTNIFQTGDSCENYNKPNSSEKASTDQVEIKFEINTLQTINGGAINPVESKEMQPEMINGGDLVLSNEAICDSDNNRSDSIQFEKTSNSEMQAYSSNFDAVEDKNKSHLLEEVLENVEEKNFEEEYCGDSQQNYCQEEPVSQPDIDSSPNKVSNDLEEGCEKPLRKYLWYSRKELYSPWIQKLILFTEGHINNINSQNKIESVDIDSLESDHESQEHKTNTTNHFLLETTQIIIPKEKDFCKTVKYFKNDSDSETQQEIMDTNVFDTPTLEDTIVKTDKYEVVCSNSPDNDTPILENTITETGKCEAVDENCLENNVDDTNEVNEPEIAINDNSINKLEEINAVHEKSAIDKLQDINVGHENVPTDEIQEINHTVDNNSDYEPDIINRTVDTATEYPLGNELENNIENERVEPSIPSNLQDNCSRSFQEMSKRADDKKIALDSSALFQDIRCSSNKLQSAEVRYKKCQTLKRSLSDSALNLYNDQERSKQEHEENVQFIWPFKRRKVNNVQNDILAQNLCNIIHNHRRNSISSIYNEENVSFCILIDNSCIITEEENEEQDKMCYTELSEDCLDAIQNGSTKNDETIESLTDVISSPRQENACDYSDSLVLECEGQKTLEESWVEDVACVETVISDDIAEDIEISGPSSPKDDVMSDNDESGVFSSSEHTDKVKYIYGDKMCNDDAQFVDTLYNTPQMDVNRALYNRETQVSQEYDRYYDNDSLEKMLSESNEPNLSPYVPEYMESMFSSEIVNSNETPENKENMKVESLSSFQNKGNALDIVVDINVDNIEPENMHSIEIFAKTQDDTVHSCESSIDNVFTYKQKDEDTIYTTSSSPEVSSTTSEEKNAGILLKITNYKGSRISQINDISGVSKRSRCKFTEDKEYLQSQNNFPTNRPLLTKAAQKYIPPLKESIRDLKVKLSLPQHSLMKLKQLKISKDEPKLNKQNPTTSRIPKKTKPKFEDVLKSIDEIQFKMHKEKTKKSKKSIPKVVIKKSENGSHYASTSNKDEFNPDLTGRKWQPWVFIEKNHFIDKMAIKKKTKAIYSHRKRTYVLAEKFQKYKSASSAKFVITPPVSDNPSSGLKYTIRLKHNY